MKKYQKGEVVKATITGIEKYGAFAKIDDEYSGLIHISEISQYFVKNINDYVTLGETIYVKILDLNNTSKQIKLSIKDIDYKMNKKKRTKIKETSQGFTTLKIMLTRWIDAKKTELLEKSKKN